VNRSLWFGNWFLLCLIKSLWYVNRSLVSVNRSLVCVNRSLVCVNRSLVCVNRSGMCVQAQTKLSVRGLGSRGCKVLYIYIYIYIYRELGLCVY